MRSTLLSLTALLFSTLVLLMGSGLLGTVLGYHMGVEGLSAPRIGMIMAGFYLGMVLGGPLCYWVVARAGHIRAFAVFAASATAITLLHGLIFDAWVWFLLRVLNGASLLGMYVVIESWLNDRAQGPARARVFSLYMVISFLGLGIGQFLLNLGTIEDASLYLIAGILFALSLLPVALTRNVHPPAPTGTGSRLAYLLKLVPHGIGGSFVAGIAMGSFFALGAVYAVQIGLEVQGISLLMGVTVLAGLFLQWPIGRLSDFYDRLSVLMVLQALMAGLALMIALTGVWHLYWLLLLGALFGGIGATLYPIAVAHVNDYADPADLVATSSTLIKAYGVGAVTGPVGASLLMGLLGAPGLFVFVAIACGAGALALLFRQRQDEEPTTQQRPFLSMPRSGSALISALDPRSWLDRRRSDRA